MNWRSDLSEVINTADLTHVGIGQTEGKMGSLNYGVFGKPFNFHGTFRVLRMKSLPSENLYYDEVEECGVSTNSTDLRALIATAQSLQMVDFGNGLVGIYGECDGFHFCAAREHEELAMEVETHAADTDHEDIF